MAKPQASPEQPVEATVDLNASDIQIGAVELQDYDSGTRLDIVADDSAMPATPAIVPVGGEYRASPTTYTDGDATVLQTDISGRSLVNTAPLDRVNDVVTAAPYKASYHYQAAAAANVVVSSTPAILVGIIIGTNIADAIIEVSDHASDGDGAVKLYLEGGDGATGIEKTLQEEFNGYVPVNAYFATGITADITNQTHVTFVFIPD